MALQYGQSMGMQRIATRVFVVSSIAFGVLGVLFFSLFLISGGDEGPSELAETVFAVWGISGSVVLVSFALSVAGKYLMDDSDTRT